MTAAAIPSYLLPERVREKGGDQTPCPHGVSEKVGMIPPSCQPFLLLLAGCGVAHIHCGGGPPHPAGEIACSVA